MNINRVFNRAMQMAEDMAELRHQNARLREALELCADATERWPDSLARQVNEIARAALTEQAS